MMPTGWLNAMVETKLGFSFLVRFIGSEMKEAILFFLSHHIRNMPSVCFLCGAMCIRTYVVRSQF